MKSKVVSLLLSASLDDVDVLPTDGLVDLDHRLAVRLVVHRAAAQPHVQVPARKQRGRKNASFMRI